MNVMTPAITITILLATCEFGSGYASAYAAEPTARVLEARNVTYGEVPPIDQYRYRRYALRGHADRNRGLILTGVLPPSIV